MALVWALPPTRETEMPTLIAGLTPELNKSVSRKICPSVIEMTFVGMYAETSPACVSMIGSAVSEPPPSLSESFAAWRAAKKQRKLAISLGLLRQVVINDQGMLATVAEPLAHRHAGISGE